MEYLMQNDLKIRIITLSDRASKGIYEDRTGKMLEEYLKINFNVKDINITLIPDEEADLKRVLKLFIEDKVDIIITNGSTGVSPRDIAPDATLSIIERRLPGFEEAMRMKSFEKVPTAIISRAVCGIAASSLIINLPGSPKAAIENLAFIAPAITHTIEKLNGDPSECGKTSENEK